MAQSGRDLVEALYNAHGRALLAYLARSFGGAEAAEDLLHETFVQALKRVSRLNEAASARAWLFGIARNVGMSAVRRRRTGPLPGDVTAPVAEESGDELECMRCAIRALSPPLRESLELRLVGELSYEEIACALGIPLGTVRSRLHNAVRRLRELLGQGVR